MQILSRSSSLYINLHPSGTGFSCLGLLASPEPLIGHRPDTVTLPVRLGPLGSPARGAETGCAWAGAAPPRAPAVVSG